MLLMRPESGANMTLKSNARNRLVKAARLRPRGLAPPASDWLRPNWPAGKLAPCYSSAMNG